MKFYYSILIVLLLAQTVNAVQVDYHVPQSITTTVGELTAIQVDIKNTGTSTEYYWVTITATLPNEMEITNPDITTQSLKPGESTSIFTNIRTLTESDNGVTIKIYRDNDLLDFILIPTISVKSKKFSLPEFGLIGFLQIIAIAAVVYFLFGHEIVKLKGKKRK